MGCKDFAFFEFNGGSGNTCLQVVVENSIPNFDDFKASIVGASFKINQKPSQG